MFFVQLAKQLQRNKIILSSFTLGGGEDSNFFIRLLLWSRSLLLHYWTNENNQNFYVSGNRYDI